MRYFLVGLLIAMPVLFYFYQKHLETEAVKVIQSLDEPSNQPEELDESQLTSKQRKMSELMPPDKRSEYINTINDRLEVEAAIDSQRAEIEELKKEDPKLTEAQDKAERAIENLINDYKVSDQGEKQ